MINREIISVIIVGLLYDWIISDNTSFVIIIIIIIIVVVVIIDVYWTQHQIMKFFFFIVIISSFYPSITYSVSILDCAHLCVCRPAFREKM